MAYISPSGAGSGSGLWVRSPHIQPMRTHSLNTSRYTKRALLALGTAAALLLPAAPAVGLGLPLSAGLSTAGLLLPAPPTTSSIPGPTVLSARAIPGSLPAKGGMVEVVGKVHGATSCHLAVLGDHGIKVTLPKPASCASGTYRRPVSLGPNHSKSAVTVKLGLNQAKSRPFRRNSEVCRGIWGLAAWGAGGFRVKAGRRPPTPLGCLPRCAHPQG